MRLNPRRRPPPISPCTFARFRGPTMQCTSCGFENPAGFRFCGNCGSPLAAAPEAAGRVFPQDAPAAADGERRQLTVMFCDLAGSTSLSASMDPEEWREVVRQYQTACVEAI